jgi:paraquat-inducible protein B
MDTALAAAGASLVQLERVAAPDSAPRRQLSQALHDLSLAARALRSLARSLEEHPEALLRGRSE